MQVHAVLPVIPNGNFSLCRLPLLCPPLLATQLLAPLTQHVAIQHRQTREIAQHDKDARSVVVEPKIQSIGQAQGKEACERGHADGDLSCSVLVQRAEIFGAESVKQQQSQDQDTFS